MTEASQSTLRLLNLGLLTCQPTDESSIHQEGIADAATTAAAAAAESAERIPHMYAPYLNRRVVSMDRLDDLISTLLKRNPVSSVNIFHNNYEMVIFSITPIVDGNAAETTTSIFTTHSPRLMSNHWKAISPQGQVDTVYKILDIQPTENQSHIVPVGEVLQFVQKVLMMDISSKAKIIDNIIRKLNDKVDITVSMLKTYATLYLEAAQLLSAANIYICMVNGSHRLYGSRLSLEKITIASLDSYSYLTRSVPFQVHCYEPTLSFQQKMLSLSDTYLTLNELHFSHDVYDEYLSLVFEAKPSLPFSLRTNIEQYVRSAVGQIVANLSKSGHWLRRYANVQGDRNAKVKSSSNAVTLSKILSPLSTKVPKWEFNFGQSDSTISLDVILYNYTNGKECIELEIKHMVFLLVAEKIVRSTDPSLELVYFRSQLGLKPMKETVLMVSFVRSIINTVIKDQWVWYKMKCTCEKEKGNNAWGSKFLFYLSFIHIWSHYMAYIKEYGKKDSFKAIIGTIMSEDSPIPFIKNLAVQYGWGHMTTYLAVFQVCIHTRGCKQVLSEKLKMLGDDREEEEEEGTADELEEFELHQLSKLPYDSPIFSEFEVHKNIFVGSAATIRRYLQHLVDNPVSDDDNSKDNDSNADEDRKEEEKVNVSKGTAGIDEKDDDQVETMESSTDRVTRKTTDSSSKPMSRKGNDSQALESQASSDVVFSTKLILQGSSSRPKDLTEASRISMVEMTGDGSAKDTLPTSDAFNPTVAANGSSSMLKELNPTGDGASSSEDSDDEMNKKASKEDDTAMRRSKRLESSTSGVSQSQQKSNPDITVNEKKTQGDDTIPMNASNEERKRKGLGCDTDTHQSSHKKSKELGLVANAKKKDAVDTGNMEEKDENECTAAKGTMDSKTMETEVVKKIMESKKVTMGPSTVDDTGPAAVEDKKKDFPLVVNHLIQEPWTVHDNEGYETWVDGETFGFQGLEALPTNVYSDNLIDVIEGRSLIHIARDMNLTVPNESGELVDPDDEDIRTEWESVVHDSRYTTTIPSGYGSKVKSSRYAVKHSTVANNPKKFVNLSKAFASIQESLEQKINVEMQSKSSTGKMNKFKLLQGSVLWDTGEFPHVQCPHVDWDVDRLKNRAPQEKPISILYAVNTFSIVVFLRNKGAFGSNVGTRLSIPKGSCLFFLYSLWHAGDIYIVEEDSDDDDDECRNARFHFYGIPSTLTQGKTAGEPSQFCIIPDNEVFRMGKGRDDLMEMRVPIVNLINYPHLGDEYVILYRLVKSLGSGRQIRYHYGKVFGMLLKLWDVLVAASSVDIMTYQDGRKFEDLGNYTAYYKDHLEAWYNMYLTQMISFVKYYLNEEEDDDNKVDIFVTDGQKSIRY